MSDHAVLFHEPTTAETDTALAELKRLIRLPLPPVPEESLKLLYQAACHDTGGSQAARSFLFWLAGQPDPTGYEGSGGIELRRFDSQLKRAALQVMEWWAGPTKSDRPLYDLLAKLHDRFAPEDVADNNNGGGRRGHGID
jgi:hypothetical protein